MNDPMQAQGAAPSSTVPLGFVPQPPLRLLTIPGRRRGHAKFYLPEKGYGFIVDDSPEQLTGQDILVHHSELFMGPGKGPSLGRGEPVEYSLNFAHRKGFSALKVTGPGGKPLRGDPSAGLEDMNVIPQDDSIDMPPAAYSAYQSLAVPSNGTSPMRIPSPLQISLQSPQVLPAHLADTGQPVSVIIESGNIDAVITKHIKLMQQAHQTIRLNVAAGGHSPLLNAAAAPQLNPVSGLYGHQSPLPQMPNYGLGLNMEPPRPTHAPWWGQPSPFGPNSPQFEAIPHNPDTSASNIGDSSLSTETSSSDLLHSSPNSSFARSTKGRPSPIIVRQSSIEPAQWSPYDDGDEPHFPVKPLKPSLTPKTSLNDSTRSQEQTPTLHSRVRTNSSKNLEPPRTVKRRPTQPNVDWSLKGNAEDSWPNENKPVLGVSTTSTV